MACRVWWQEQEVTGHIAPTFMNHFIQSGIPAHRMVLPTLRADLPTLINLV